MSEPPRRRRSSRYTPPTGDRGGFPIWPLLIVIVVLGFFIGGALARFLGAPKIAVNQRTVQPTPLPTVQFTVAPTPAPTPVPTEPPTPSPLPSVQATVAVFPTPSKPPKVVAAAPTSTPTATPTVAPTPIETPSMPAAQAQTATPVPTSPPRRTLPVARKPEPTASPPSASAASTPPSAAQSPSGIVRSYINALANGNRAGAQQYLSSGSVDQDSFIDGSAQITNVRTSRNADGSSKVDVDLNTASGKYFITFTVSEDRITDHTAIKP